MIKLAFWDFKQVQHKLGCVATGTSYRQINLYKEKLTDQTDTQKN